MVSFLLDSTEPHRIRQKDRGRFLLFVFYGGPLTVKDTAGIGIRMRSSGTF